MSYAELHCISNFTFLRGASHPAELVERAVALGYSALAITDECSVAGVVRAHVAARKHGLQQLVIGSELRLTDGLRLVLLAANRSGYGQLCTLISRGRRAAGKGSYRLERADLETSLDQCLALWLAGTGPGVDALAGTGADHMSRLPDPADAAWLRRHFPGRLWLAIGVHANGNDRSRLEQLLEFSAAQGIPPVATGDVHMHVRRRRIVQDTLTAIRLGVPLGQDISSLHPNGEKHLRTLESLRRSYPAHLLEATLEIAGRIHFSLDELHYQYPHEVVPPGHTATSYLRLRTFEGMAERWPAGAPAAVLDTIERELRLIEELHYEPYFLTVEDIVRYARSRGILCQGRGSAANSTVCFCLGITEVDPEHMSLLFERFVSRERNEPPDIDVDFEHERREEVIQYIYDKYGRERAALTATVITYCSRSAVRDIGRALGLSEAQLGQLAGNLQWWDAPEVRAERLRETGLDPESPILRRLTALMGEIIGFPRHLSQHVGGFVISEAPLHFLVPVENAAMEGRTVIQWDKVDLDDLGLLKVDVLGLGMLTAIHRCFDLLEEHEGRRFRLNDVPQDDPAVYDMISRADTVGVFQVESRAQMSMLPRLRPRSFYDLVIQVAIVRPGPIQGDMVHPYLRRRNREEAVDYPSPDVRAVLERTLGVPIFQEQVMQLAMVAAGFTPGEADGLRRAMAAWQRRGGLEPFEDRLLSGMQERGYSMEFAQQVFRQIRGFGEYGFPESHAASFALLVYVSAWLKHHAPAAFTCALLNSQPMGFYAPAQLLQDARRHGVDVRPVDVNDSQWECTLEKGPGGGLALRLGLRLVRGLSEEGARHIVETRAAARYRDVQDVHERSCASRHDLESLSASGAFASLAGNRHLAYWEVAGVEAPLPVFSSMRIAEGIPLLAAPTEGQEIVADYHTLGLSLRRHPLALLRARLRRLGYLTAEELQALSGQEVVLAAGLVTIRQRPGSARGVIFVTLEDETGYVNLIVWPGLAERQRRVLLQARLLAVTGELQRQGDVLHIVARHLEDHTPLLGALVAKSRDFH